MRTVNLTRGAETDSNEIDSLFKRFESKIKWAHARRYDHHVLSALRRRIHAGFSGGVKCVIRS